MDITGDGGVEFFSNRIKVTSKWPLIMSSQSRKRKEAGGDMNGGTITTNTDRANFAGNM